MSKDCLFVYRPVASENLPIIRAVQENLSEVPSFRPVENPHLTLLHGNITKRLGMRALEKIVHPLPPTANDQLRLGSGDIDMYIRRHSSRASYAISLEDVDDVFHDEFKAFTQRIRSLRNKVHFTRDPHVTLGYVDYEHATADSLSVVRTNLPDTLLFDGIVTEPVVPETIVTAPAVNKAFKRPCPPVEGAAVRTVAPGTIPAGFLARLHAAVISETANQ